MCVYRTFKNNEIPMCKLMEKKGKSWDFSTHSLNILNPTAPFLKKCVFLSCLLPSPLWVLKFLSFQCPGAGEAEN
jgi:hypothetical protein